MSTPRPFIGSVFLAYPLAWQNKPLASLGPGKIGADVRTMTGDMVFITAKPQGEGEAKFPVEAIFLFDWETEETVASLNALWDAGQAVEADFEAAGKTYSFKFAVENGLAEVEHSFYGAGAIYSAIAGHPTDCFKGKINGYILSGL